MVTYFSCYFKLNKPIQDFQYDQYKLEDLEDAIQNMAESIIVDGDFNRKALEWVPPH